MGWPADGTYRCDGSSSLVKVFTFKTAGLVSRFAHDLELHTHAIEGSVSVSGDVADVDVRISLWELAVRDGLLSGLEAREAEKVLRKKILKKQDKAFARFSGKAERKGESAVLRGELSLLGGRARKVELTTDLPEADADGFVVDVGHELMQTDYGITPFKAMMGMLKLEDRVRVEVHAVVRR